MFGYLRGPRSRRYRQIYARCCSVQKAEFGLRSLPLVSYEAIFLYSLAVDIDLIPAPGDGSPTCCRMRTAKQSDMVATEYAAAQFAANFALLLGKTKLEDDIADGNSIVAHTGRFAIRRPIRRMLAYFNDLDSSAHQSLRQHLEDHADLERLARSYPIDQYARPTADAFADVFALFSTAISSDQQRRWLFEDIGRHLGASIVAFDCATDWRRDRRRGDYNPLRDQGEVDHAFAYASQQLSAAGWKIADHAESSSIALTILQHRVALNSRARETSPARCHNRSRKVRAALARAGFCDCDCGDCDACDACHCCCCCESPVEDRKGQEQADAMRAKTNELIGCKGHATSLLAPYGTVMVKERERPAKAEFGSIEQGQPILVTDERSFGLVVRVDENPNT